MVRMLVAALAVVGALLVPAAPAMAQSVGFTTDDVNMRAGPSTGYPRIIVLPRGGEIEVFGCVQGYTWCDVGYYDYRGWVSSRYLSLFYDNDYRYVPYEPRVVLPIIAFDWGYWDTWYRPYSWYNEDRWRRTVPRWQYYNERRRNDDVVIYPRNRDRYDEPRRNDDVTVYRNRNSNRDGRADIRRGDSIEDVMDPGRRVGIGANRNNDRNVAEPRRNSNRDGVANPRRGDTITTGGERRKNSIRAGRNNGGDRVDTPRKQPKPQKQTRQQKQQKQQRQQVEGGGNRGGGNKGGAARNDGATGLGVPCVMVNGRCAR